MSHTIPIRMTLTCEEGIDGPDTGATEEEIADFGSGHNVVREVDSIFVQALESKF